MTWKTRFSVVAKLGPTAPTTSDRRQRRDKESTLSLQLRGRPKNGTEKNDERQNKACKIGKENNDKASRCC